MVWQSRLFVISLKLFQALITATKYVTPAEISVSHDFFPGTYFWVIIQQKVLTKLEFCVNPLFPPLTALYPILIECQAVQVTAPLWGLGSLSVHRTKEPKSVSDFLENTWCHWGLPVWLLMFSASCLSTTDEDCHEVLLAAAFSLLEQHSLLELKNIPQYHDYK